MLTALKTTKNSFIYYYNNYRTRPEAKEGVKISEENKTLATVSYQNYFRMYKKLSGMTGTAFTDKYEFKTIYNLDVVQVPTNKPIIRKDIAIIAPTILLITSIGCEHPSKASLIADFNNSFIILLVFIITM